MSPNIAVKGQVGVALSALVDLNTKNNYMKVVLDTNIYLNFFRKRDDQSLVYIKSLLNLIEKKKFQLILPIQVKN